MVAVSIVRGWIPREERERLAQGSSLAAEQRSAVPGAAVDHAPSVDPQDHGSDWLAVSRQMVSQAIADDGVPETESRPWWTAPALWTILLVSIVLLLNLVIYW